MKGPSSKISEKLKANEAYVNMESNYLFNKGTLEGKFSVSGSTYIVFQNDIAPTLRKIDSLRQKLAKFSA